jgi:hypothetical protein
MSRLKGFRSWSIFFASELALIRSALARVCLGNGCVQHETAARRSRLVFLHLHR